MLSRLYLLLICCLLPGCILVFNKEMLPSVEINPPNKNLPFVELKIGEFLRKGNGKPVIKYYDDKHVFTSVNSKTIKLNGGDVFTQKTPLFSLGQSMMERWKNQGLIEGYTLPKVLKNQPKPDYTVSISGSINEEISTGFIFVLYFSFGSLPALTKSTYDLNMVINNNKTNKTYSINIKEGYTMWIHAALLPFTPFNFITTNNRENDMADYSYHQLQMQGAFEN